MKNMLFELFSELENLIPKVSELDAYDITFEKIPNGFIYQAVRKPEVVDEELLNEIKEFKGYIQTIEDAFFEYGCNKFNSISEISLNDFQNLLENPSEAKDVDLRNLMNLYKYCIKEAVTDYIVELQEKYELNK